MKPWRIVGLSLIGLGALYVISDLVYDFFGIQWAILRIPLCTTMVYGLFLLTWGIVVWWQFGGKK